MTGWHILVGKTTFSIMEIKFNYIIFAEILKSFLDLYKLQRPENSYNSGFLQVKETLINKSVKNTLNSIFHY